MKRLCHALLLSAGLAGAAEPPTLELGVLVSGVVERVDARVGQRVKAGELLLRLEAAPFQARVAAARARVAARRAALDQARRDLTRAEELYEQTLLSDYELASARRAELAARADLAEAEAALTEARLALARSRLRAPVAGRVVEVRSWPGQAVQNACAIQPLILLEPEKEKTAP